MKFIDEQIEAYCLEKSERPSELCRELAETTRKQVPLSQMLIGEMEGSFLGFLLRALQAKRVLEFGTYTGYSALAMAEQLPADGEVITLDINPETTELGRESWEKSPHGRKITLLLGEAEQTLKQVEGKFDLIFIDADKENYLNYLESSLSMLSERGVIVLDNCLWSGKVLERETPEASTRAIQQVNDFIAASGKLYGTLLPIRDGMFLVVPKRF